MQVKLDRTGEGGARVQIGPAPVSGRSLTCPSTGQTLQRWAPAYGGIVSCEQGFPRRTGGCGCWIIDWLRELSTQLTPHEGLTSPGSGSWG